MRFSQIDIFIDLARLLGGAMMLASALGAIANWISLDRGDLFFWHFWFSAFCTGLGLVVVCTGVLAQIVTARATQDALHELRKIREAAESVKRT